MSRRRNYSQVPAVETISTVRETGDEFIALTRNTPISFELPSQLPRVPRCVQSIESSELRQRGREAWRLAHQLRELLGLWISFVYCAASGNSVNNETDVTISRRWPELTHYGEAINTLVALRGGDLQANGMAVLDLAFEFSKAFNRLFQSFYLLGIQKPPFNESLDVALATPQAITRLPPKIGHPTILPGNESTLIPSYGAGICDVDFLKKFGTFNENELRFKRQLEELIAILNTSPTAALKEGIELKPKWIPERKELIVGPTVIRTFKRAARSQLALLNALQNAEWPKTVKIVDLDPKELNSAIRNLNLHLSPKLISFHGDGEANGVAWQWETLPTTPPK